MRKLMLFTCGFTLAAVLWAYLLSAKVLIWVSFIAAILILGLLLLNKRCFKVAAVVLFGLFVGILFCRVFDAVVLQDVQRYDGKILSARIEATDYARTGNGTDIVDGKIFVNGKSYKVILYVNSAWDIEPGDVLEGSVKLCYTAHSNKSYVSNQKANGCYLIAYAEDRMMVTKSLEIPYKYYPAVLFKKICDQIEKVFPSLTMGFAKALLLGDDSDIGYRENITYQESGIRHIIAVSGLHVSILFSLVFYITGRKKLSTVLVGFPVLLLFAAVTGFTPSVVRACVMQALMILAVALGKDYDPITALAFAVLLMLLSNPFAVTSVSLQLSVSCMLGIILFSVPVKNYISDEKRLGSLKGNTIKAKMKRWFAGSVSASVSSLVFTMPLCAGYFGFTSLIGILTNLLTLWCVSTIFCGIIAATVLSVFSLSLGKVVGMVMSVPILFVQWISELLSRIPFGAAYTDSIYTVLWVAVAYLLITVHLLSRKKKTTMLVCSIIALYAVSLLFTWLEPYTDNFRMTAIDVGQGQAILLQSKSSAYLIDCGGTNAENTATETKNALKAQGVNSLDGVILTHFDQDHCNGLPYLQQIVNIDRIYFPASDAQRFRQMQIDPSVAVLQVEEDMTISCGKGTITLFPSKNGEDHNERSMCILFQCEDYDILITGDRNITGEIQLLRYGNIPDIEILVAGHHGAEDATGLALLEYTKPEIVVISVGENNRYNHPAEDTLARIQQFGCIVRRTDQEGNIVIRG